MRIARGAVGLQEAGCFCIVFEAVPSALTEELMPLMTVPIIGIGAGPATDGQVLVFHDLLGIREGKGAKFVRRYADLLDAMADGVAEYAEEVRSGVFPAAEHGYGIDEAELAKFRGCAGELHVLRTRSDAGTGDEEFDPADGAGADRGAGPAPHRERGRQQGRRDPGRRTGGGDHARFRLGCHGDRGGAGPAVRGRRGRTADRRRPGRTLMFEGHVDVVTEGDPDLWSFDPYAGDVVDGRLRGRGSADMKSGVAAMIHAARAVQLGGFAGRIVVGVLADEEGMMLGAKRFAADLQAGAVPGWTGRSTG